ncbi:MAG: aminodeoxychorismate synthase component I [Firmicutes bacterium]|nr:aminodeoxychorismate synthase component I [Bacillota bacterium]
MIYSYPPEYYQWLNNSSNLVFLETCRFDQENYQSWLFADPLDVLQINHSSEFPGLFERIEAYVSQQNYVAGYFTYECGYHFENITGIKSSPRPLAWFGVYSKPAVFNHYAGEWGQGPPDPGLRGFGEIPTEGFHIDNPVLTLSSPVYCQKIGRIKEYIAAGDVYQINFTGKYRFGFKGSPAALYHFLRAQQPVSYAAYLRTEGLTVLSFSPELFFRRDGSKVMTKPMKGTAARGRTVEEDFRLAEQLRLSPKNRAENLMIVDLLRNDLGRIGVFGSVRVPEIFTIEKYQTLFQMTSTITARLPADIPYYEIFRSLFPCGSVTGAPKIRAMEIIAELEPEPRGIYTGAIGYFGPDGQAVFNVPIRTLALTGDQGEMGVGSGVVFDSDPEAEYQECKLKADFFIVRRPEFELIETMLWDQGYPYLDKHWRRLLSSAAYFDYPVDPDEFASRLGDFALPFQPGQKYKVRVAVSKSGKMEITSEKIDPPGQAANLRVILAGARTDSRDPFLYHKTTHRPLYGRMFREAAQKGMADVIFRNERNEITEGAISNILIERDGLLITPPVSCGLLNGVYRSHLLETRANIVEQIITEQDIRTAGGIYICNAVRGLRKVKLLNY